MPSDARLTAVNGGVLWERWGLFCFFLQLSSCDSNTISDGNLYDFIETNAVIDSILQSYSLSDFY